MRPRVKHVGGVSVPDKGSWVGAGLFFLAGSHLVAAAVIARSLLLAALWNARTNFDMAIGENQVPAFLYGFAWVAFGLSAVALLWPWLRKTLAELARALKAPE